MTKVDLIIHQDTKHLAKIKELEEQLEQQRKQIDTLEEASTAAAEEKLALESQLEMSQAAYPLDSEVRSSRPYALILSAKHK